MIRSWLVSLAEALAPTTWFVEVLDRLRSPPPKRVAPAAAMVRVPVAVSPPLRAIEPERVTLAPLITALLVEMAAAERVSEPPVRATTPAPARVPARRLPLPVRLIRAPAPTVSVPPLSVHSPALLRFGASTVTIEDAALDHLGNAQGRRRAEDRRAPGQGNGAASAQGPLDVEELAGGDVQRSWRGRSWPQGRSPAWRSR